MGLKDLLLWGGTKNSRNEDISYRLDDIRPCLSFTIGAAITGIAVLVFCAFCSAEQTSSKCEQKEIPSCWLETVILLVMR